MLPVNCRSGIWAIFTPAPTDPRIEADLAQAGDEAKKFEQDHRGRLAGLSGAELAQAVQNYERIEERLGRVMSYAQLLFSADSTDPAHGKFYQTMSERVTTISTHLLFFTLELNRIGEAELAEKLRIGHRPAESLLGSRNPAPPAPTPHRSARRDAPANFLREFFRLVHRSASMRGSLAPA